MQSVDEELPPDSLEWEKAYIKAQEWELSEHQLPWFFMCTTSMVRALEWLPSGHRHFYI